MVFIELPVRSIIKTLTYRFLIIVSNFTLAFILTKSLDVATKVAGLTFIINTIIYFLHERAWNKILWGKKKKK